MDKKADDNMIRKHRKTCSLDTLARELFNTLNQEKDCEVTKTPQQSGFLFTISKKQKLISKLVPIKYHILLNEENGYFVFQYENQDTEPVLFKYAKAWVICPAGIALLKQQLAEAGKFPDFIDSIVRKILASQS